MILEMQPRQARLIELGIEHCRVEEWELGLEYLSRAFASGPPDHVEHALATSYLGCALARQGRRKRGLRLCLRAVERDPLQPEVYLNLARAHLEMGSRRHAVEALERGLEVDPEHSGLLVLRHRLGVRRPQVLRFLRRDNLLNRYLGRVRHRLR
jgi:tetratricopeptide (TPR) repeat protein